MPDVNTREGLAAAVRTAVDDVTITDIHTHLFPPAHGDLLLWGIDELLTYHYLVAELFTIAPSDLTPEKFWKMSKTEQADLVWKHVFLDHGALSEACRGVVTTLRLLGLDVKARDLAGIRKWFAEQDEEEYIAKVFELAGLDYAVMTNDPFVDEEVAHWQSGAAGWDTLKPALRIDPLIVNWPKAVATMKAQGYDVTEELSNANYATARTFLADWARKMGDPVYMAASLPPSFRYPADDTMAQVVQNVIMPTAEELGLPMAMMIGVRKQVNPALGDGGDAVGIADVESVMNLCKQNPNVKFLVTMLSRVNQHELCVAARKFGNLHLFGCWWYCNDPSIIDEMTRQRFELLGATFTANHSDARVLDQLIYKWSHTRKVVGDVAVDKYLDLFDAGWRPTEQEIARDVRGIFGGRFEEFLAK
ncbi:MAG: glucuronate isomerase [Phycisphaerae bacterium]